MKKFKILKITSSVFLILLVIIGTSFTQKILKSNVQAFESGAYYKIKSAHSGKVLTVESGGSNVHQWTWNGSRRQQWQIIHRGGRDYVLVNRDSGKVLEVTRTAGVPSLHDGANVRENDWRGRDHQQWTMERPSGLLQNTRQIIELKFRNKVLDISGRRTTNGANIHQWRRHGADSQRWQIIKVRDNSIESGELYRIRSRHSDKVLTLESNGNVVQRDWSGPNTRNHDQQWRIESDTAGYYIVRPRGRNRSLTVEGESSSNGANITTTVLGSVSGAQDHQLWMIMSARGSNLYRFVAKNSDKALDIEGRRTGNGANIEQRSVKDYNSQRWRIERLHRTTSLHTRVSRRDIDWDNSIYFSGESRPRASHRLRVGDIIQITTPRPRVKRVDTYHIPTRTTEHIMSAQIERASSESSTSISWSRQSTRNNTTFTGVVTRVDDSNPDYSFRITYRFNEETFGHPTITGNIGILREPILSIPDVTIFKGEELDVTASIENNDGSFRVSSWSVSDTSIVSAKSSGRNVGRLTANEVGGTTVTATLNDGRTGFEPTQKTFNVRVIDVAPLEPLQIHNLTDITHTQRLSVENVEDIRDEGENFEYIIENPKPELLDVQINTSALGTWRRTNNQGEVVEFSSSHPINYTVKPDGFNPDTVNPFDINIRVRYLNENNSVSEKTITQTITPIYIVIDIN